MCVCVCVCVCVMISIPPRYTSPHHDSAGTAPSGTPLPAQPRVCAYKYSNIYMYITIYLFKAGLDPDAPMLVVYR